MILSASPWSSLDDLILVAGHAIYIGHDCASADLDSSWVLKKFQRGEPPLLIEHVRAGVVLAAELRSALLVFSGGQTSSDAGPVSEAQGYWQLADQFDWWGLPDVRARATTEEFARDSFENLLFGIARFKEATGRFPSCVHVIGWEFKRERFDFHRKTIGWPAEDAQYRYHGVGVPADVTASAEAEAKTLAAFHDDPFGCGGELEGKRARRNPFNRQVPYTSSCQELADLIFH